MFDVVIHAALVRILAMDIHTHIPPSSTSGGNTGSGSDTVDVVVYTRSGTWQGRDKHPGAWTQISSVTVISQGLGVPTPLPLTAFSPVVVTQDQPVQGFYTTISNGRYMQYTSSTGLSLTSGDVYTAAAADLSVLVGAGKNHLFFHTQRDAIWNGSLYYAVVNSATKDIDNTNASSSSSSRLYPRSTGVASLVMLVVVAASITML